MKKFNLKEKFLKITLAAVTVGMFFGAIFAAPLNTNAATSPTGPVAMTEGKVLFADELFAADGDYTSAGINDPKPVYGYGGNVHYEPGDYIYYGVDSKGNPLKWRVLDANADNAGGDGAVFLFSEQVISVNDVFSYTEDDYKYFFYDNCMIYNANNPDDKYNVKETVGGRFEFTYQGSYMQKYGNNLKFFVPRDHYYNYHNSFSIIESGLPLDVHELSALRPVTKKDDLPETDYGMNDEYFYWTLDTLFDEDGALYADTVLSSDYIFPLSLEELEKYVANYSGAPGLATTSSQIGSKSGWWLRTAYQSDEFRGETKEGYPRANIAVGYVDENGTVGIMDVNNNGGGRYGINLEKDRISFATQIADGEWRLALIEPYYYGASAEEDFNAWFEDVKLISEPVLDEDGEEIGRNEYKKFYIGYENAIGRYQPNYWDEDACEEFISVMIKDKNGNVKYYGTGDLASKVNEYNKVTEGQGVAEVAVPSDVDFDERDGDKLLVFWERRYDDEKKTSFVSNMVEIECAHSDFTIPNCIDDSMCQICGEHFGGVDPENHLNRKNFDGTPENPQHGYICVTDGCPLYNQVVYAEACTVVSDCIEIFEYCSCGNGYLDENDHVFEKPDDPDYVVTGFCEFSNKHYQPAKINAYGEYVISNEGNFLWVMEQINKGNTFEGKTIKVAVDELDFDGIEYFNAGTSFTSSFKGTFDGNDVIIRNLTIDSSSNSSIFGYTNGATIKNIRIEDLYILGGYNGAALASYASDTIFKNIIIICDNTVVDTVNGVNASIVVDASGNTVIEDCFVYGPTFGGYYDPSLEGTPLPFFAKGAETVRVINSYCLAEEANDNGGRTAEQMASGEIAFILGWGQKLGTDDYPTPNSVWIVYQVPNCGDSGKVYSNNIDGRENHDMTVFVKEDGFRWDGMYCTVTFACERCGHKVEERLTPENGGIEIEDMGGGASYTFTAVIDASNGYFTDENFVIAKRIEDVTAVERIVKDFDGEFVSADDFLTNTKMNYKGFHTSSDAFAYFVDSVTGEYLGTSVAAAGVYDLVVDGRRGYETQKYIYEEILVINKITLTLDVKVDPKFYDGTTDITYSYGFLEDTDISLDWLEVILAKPLSSEVGEYKVALTLKYDRGVPHYPENPKYLDNPYSNEYYDYNTVFYYYDDYKESIELVYDKNVTVFISPARQVEISANDLWKDNFVEENPGDLSTYDHYIFEYGEEIAAPTAADFSFSEGSKLSFQWYEKQYKDYWEYSLVKLDKQPTDAGKYILRVTASATDNLVSNSVDIEVEIAPKTLTVEFIIPDDAEYIDYYGDKYYIFEYGEYPEFTIGIPEEEWAELGITFEGWNRTEIENAYRYYSGYPTKPGLYRVDAEMNIADGFNRAENYVIEHNTSINIKLVAPGAAIPVDAEYIFDGEAKEIEVVLPEGWTDADYSVEIVNELGDTVTEIKAAGIYTVTVTDKNGAVNSATVTVRKELDFYFKETFIELSSDGVIEFDLKDFYFTPGYTLAIGHELVGVDYRIDVDYGEIEIMGVTVMAGDEDVSYLYYISNGKNFGHGDGNFKTIHIFDNPCDGDCNARGCDFTRTVEGHHGGVATCLSLAICESCGYEYGSLDTERHASDKLIFVPSASDFMMHDKVYACCGERVESEAHHADVAATCTDVAICKVCSAEGFRFGALDPDNHSSEEIRYAVNEEDAGKHDVYHSCCDALIETAEHSGGVADCVSLAVCEYCENEYGSLDSENHADVENHTKATCISLAKCSACEAEYGSLDPENHESDGFATVPSATDNSVHEKYHSCCDTLAFTEEHVGGKATCNSLAECEVCGAKWGTVDPENHASEELVYSKNDADDGTHSVSRACCGTDPVTEAHSGGKATCHSQAVCDKCGEAYGSLAEHSYDNACDTVCNACDQPTRGLSFHIDSDKDGICDECGADISESIVGAVDGPADDDVAEEEEGLSGRAISAIAVGSTAVVGTGSFSLIWFVIQKKSWAELLGLLIG